MCRSEYVCVAKAMVHIEMDEWKTCDCGSYLTPVHDHIMYLWWYHVTNSMVTIVWVQGPYMGLRVDSESVTNSEKALFNGEDLPSSEAM